MGSQKAPIDFASGQQSSNEQLAGAIPQSVNVLVDGTGAIHLRPGISAWPDFGPTPLLDPTTSVDGITIWNNYPVYVTSDRLIHAQIAPGFGTDLSDATAASQLDGATRPVFATTKTRVVIAGGGLLQKWEGLGFPLSARLGGSPPAATHVVSIFLRLVINPIGAPGQIQWSDPGDPGNEVWPGEFSELEAKPDPLPSLYTNTGELVCGGTETVQVGTLERDANGVFFNDVRIWSNGYGAPYSQAADDETFGFLDNLRRIQYGNGRSYQAISDPALTSTLSEAATIADCWGFRMRIGSYDLLGWHFPTIGRTFVFDTGRKAWSEWRGYAGGQWEAWKAMSHCFWPDKNRHLIGLGDGTIAQMDTRVANDMGDPIVADVYSGFNDRGVDNWKQNVSVRLMFKRGVGAFGQNPAPKCQLFWRDSVGAWEEPLELDLGNIDDTAPVVEVRSLGTYKTRQWRLRFSDNVPLTFVGAIETFNLLES